MSEINEFGDLKGHTLIQAAREGDELHFTLTDGRRFKLHHIQDCCESVVLEDVCGDLADLVGAPLLMAEEACSAEPPEGWQEPEYRDESETWTFYRLATVKGYVTVRFYGSSNGWYSESADFSPA